MRHRPVLADHGPRQSSLDRPHACQGACAAAANNAAIRINLIGIVTEMIPPFKRNWYTNLG
jgi:hypothetical protein